MTKKMLTTKEAAAILDVSESRVRQLLGNKTLKGVKIPPDMYRGVWKVEQESVMRYSLLRRKRRK